MRRRRAKPREGHGGLGASQAARASAAPRAPRNQGEARTASPAEGGGTPAPSPVLLAWALDRDGRKVHVGTLDEASRRARGPFTCLACREHLVARLGAVRAHHFAHPPGAECALTRPETVLHLDAKERLLALCADAFAGRVAVRLGARCPACRRETPLDLGALGDGAVAEGLAGARRADVLVTRGGAPALALEVKVSHAVDAAKEAALAALGLPTLEIDAREDWEVAVPGGVAVTVARTLGLPRCPSCEAGARAEADRSQGGEAAAVAELEAYRARGLMGSRPGAALPGTPRLDPADRAALSGRFRCPDCGGRALLVGDRLARHACPGGAPRPAAWKGYDGALVELSWWKRR